MYYYKMKYSLATMEEYLKNGKAIDATKGGLILGRSHDEGGIYFWIKEDDYYVLEGEVEGYEYIMNFGATKYYSKSCERFHQYENHKHDFVEYIPSSDITLLDTRHGVEPKFLLFDDNGFSIINKYSTKGYLNTIDQMNKAVTYEIIGENLAQYCYNQNEKIEIKFYDTLEGYIHTRDSD